MFGDRTMAYVNTISKMFCFATVSLGFVAFGLGASTGNLDLAAIGGFVIPISCAVAAVVYGRGQS